MQLRFLIPALAGALALAFFALPETDGQVATQGGNNLSIFFTGDTDGEIVPCGCPELDYGGASRKAGFFNKLRGAEWEFLTLDVGGIAPFAEMNSQLRIKTEALARSMSTMGYDAVALGDNDLALGPEFVEDLIGWLGQPIVATNYDTGLDQVRTKIVTVRDRKVGVVGFLDPQNVTEEHDWLEVEPWEDQKGRIDELAEQVDVIVAAVNAKHWARLISFARMYPEVRVVLGSHRGDLDPEINFEEKTAIMGAPPKGRFLGRVEVRFNDENQIRKIEGIALPVQEHWGADEQVDEIVGNYYRELRTLITTDKFLEERMDNLKEPFREYVGNETCAGCHTPQFDQWKDTPHAHAKETLEADGKDQVPECQSCHTTGYGYRTGFVTPDTTPDMWQVGCETCHGPGAGHVEDTAAPYGIIVEAACADCHTDHDSPDFDYETYLPQVTH